MSRPRSGHHKDAIHDYLVEIWESRGLLVLSLVAVGRGAPDVMVLRPWRPFRGALVEIKARKGKLREAQQKFQSKGWPVYVIRDEAGAQALAEELING